MVVAIPLQTHHSNINNALMPLWHQSEKPMLNSIKICRQIIFCYKTKFLYSEDLEKSASWCTM